MHYGGVSYMHGILMTCVFLSSNYTDWMEIFSSQFVKTLWNLQLSIWSSLILKAYALHQLCPPLIALSNNLCGQQHSSMLYMNENTGTRKSLCSNVVYATQTSVKTRNESLGIWHPRGHFESKRVALKKDTTLPLQND